jgi:hypothetical protein
MSKNLYNRFIDAFKDENEIITNEKRSPLVSDEKLEDTFKTLKNTIKNLKSTNDEKEKKSSRFQRWIMYYLKAPFKKWEKKIDDKQQVNSNIELKSSSHIDADDDDLSESDDEDEHNQEEYSTITEKIKQRLEIVKDFGEDIKSKVCVL